MSKLSRWLLILFLALMLHVAFAILFGAAEGRTIWPYTQAYGSFWVGNALGELQLATMVLITLAGSLLFDGLSGKR